MQINTNTDLYNFYYKSIRNPLCELRMLEL